MTTLAKVLAQAAIGMTFAATAMAQTAPENDQSTDASKKKDQSNPDTTTTTSTPSTTTTTTTTTPDTGTTVDANGQIGTDVNGQVGAQGTVGAGIQTPPPPPPAPTTTVVQTPAPTYVTTTPVRHTITEEHEGPMSGIGIEVAAGGGAGGFVNDALRSTTNTGGDWDVRATVGTRSPIALEGSYIGSAQGINALGLDNNAILVGNGVQGALRLNATMNLPVQPFAYAGAAWRRYDLTNTNTNTSDVAGKDDVLEIPLGIGIAGRAGGFMLDVRGEYRVARNEDLLMGSSGSPEGMNRWGAKANIGIEF